MTGNYPALKVGSKMDKQKLTFFYGIILIVVGIAVFIRVPQVIPQLETIAFFKNKIGIVEFCSYFLGFLLVLAGGIRVAGNHKKS